MKPRTTVKDQEEQARERRVVPTNPKHGDVDVMRQEQSVSTKILAALREKNKKALDLTQKAYKALGDVAGQGDSIAPLTNDPAKLETVKANFGAVLNELRALVQGVKQELREADQLVAKAQNEVEHKTPRLK